MSKYFMYRSLDDLRNDIARRGVEIAFSEDVSSLLEPVEIDGLTVGNRLAVHPMEGCDGDLDGRPGELTFRRWERFGSGGAKLIWGEATAVVPEGRANPRQMLLNDANAPEIERLLKATRAAHRARFGDDRDLVVGLQLTHSGRFSYQRPMIVHHAMPVDAAKGLAADYPLLDDHYLEQLEDRYVDTAALAARVGFDFVDIKQCHTYLLNELLAARGRTGRYGGNWDGRTRFVRNVIGKIREHAPGLRIASRVNVYDGPPFRSGTDGVGEANGARPYEWGFGTGARDPLNPDLKEPLELVGVLRELGVRLINVTMGSPYFNAHIGRPFERAPVDGYTTPEHPLVGVERHFRLTAEVQAAHPDVVVVGTGYSWLRHYAPNAGAANVATGRVSMMGLGRGALAYPDFAADLMEQGSMVDRKSCIGVSYCTTLMRAKGNEMGQFAVGCVPRDPIYAEEFKASQATRS